MPTDHNAQGRRPHYNRGRRGPDRRGQERRSSPASPEQAGRPQGDQVDVEQIMRDIRARIAQRHGIELSSQQIQELAARRLEAILDPRTINPSLMEQLRRGAAATPQIASPAADPGYAFEDTTLYESHRGFLRFMRRLLNPLLKLFFNPNPLIHALNTQARLNKEAAARDVERERQQAEWNALHYDILQRLVTEVSRVSIETQSLALRVESLSTKVDFNDRRVRSLENSVPQGRERQPPPPRAEPVPASAVPQEAAASQPAAAGGGGDAAAGTDGTRRKRRRRRGRRSGGGAAAEGTTVPTAGAMTDSAGPDAGDSEEGDEDEGVDQIEQVTELAAAPMAHPVPDATVPAMTAAPPALEPQPMQPTPPRDEPTPAAPVDHPDPGPPER
jgi:hypothetical protein